MRKHHVGDVVVVEERDRQRVPLGIVTDRDIVIETMALGLDATELGGRREPLVHEISRRVPVGAVSLRWYYGLPIDPYPLTIRRADGRIVVEEIAGDAWSRPIDLSGQFQAPRVTATTAGAAIGGLLLIPIALRVRSALRRR